MSAPSCARWPEGCKTPPTPAPAMRRAGTRNSPAVSRVAPRADAARIWLLLAAHGEHDDELLDGIRRAARDESPEVRRRVAEAAWWLRDTEEHVAWELAEQLAAAEPRWNVAVTNLDNLRALATLDRERALAAVVSLHRRMLAAGAPNWAVAASSVQLLAHWVDHGAAAGHEELDRVVDLAATDPDRADHAISPWRQILTAGDATEEATARRSRAIEMWTRIAEAALTPFERLITADDRNEDQLKALGHLLLKIAAEVQFAAGASGLDRDPDDWQPTAEQHARLWQEASALLDAACRIGIPAAADDIVKTLASYIDHDPKGVLRRLTKVLATAEPFGYQSDTLAETSFNRLVAALLSRQRDVIVADADSRARLSRRSRRSSAPARGRRAGPSSASTISCADIALACATRGSPARGARPRSRRPTNSVQVTLQRREADLLVPMKPWNGGRLQPTGRSLLCRVPDPRSVAPFAVAVEELQRRAALSHHARAKQVREQSQCSAGVGSSPRQPSRGSDARIGRRAGDAARIRPRPDVSRKTVKTRKPPRSKRFLDGETRTRTGDTTIFSRVLYQLSYLAVAAQEPSAPGATR